MNMRMMLCAAMVSAAMSLFAAYTSEQEAAKDARAFFLKQDFQVGGEAYEAAATLAQSDEQKLRYWHEAFNNYQNVSPEVFAAKCDAALKLFKGNLKAEFAITHRKAQGLTRMRRYDFDNDVWYRVIELGKAVVKAETDPLKKRDLIFTVSDLYNNNCSSGGGDNWDYDYAKQALEIKGLDTKQTANAYERLVKKAEGRKLSGKGPYEKLMDDDIAAYKAKIAELTGIDPNAKPDKPAAEKKPATSAQEIFTAKMAEAAELKNAKKYEEAIAKAEEAIKMKETFDKQRAYDFIGQIHLDASSWRSPTYQDAVDHFEKFIQVSERYYAERELNGVSSNVAARIYTRIGYMIGRHAGQVPRDCKRAIDYFKKGVSLGLDPMSIRGDIAWLEHTLKLEAAVPAFPDRDWKEKRAGERKALEKRLEKSGKTVRVKDYGWDKDDSLKAIQAALDDPEASVLVFDDMGSPWYVSNSIRMRSNKKLVFKKGVEICAKRYEFRTFNTPLFAFHNVSDIVLEGLGKEPTLCHMWKRDYQENKDLYPVWTDTRDCIRMRGAQNIFIRNCQFNSSGGDGCITTGGGGVNTSNVWFDTCKFLDNIRQGLSIVDSTTFLYASDCDFSYTWGGEPMSGIDVEPWCEAFDCHDIYVDQCRFVGNRCDGIVIMNSTFRPFTMFVKDCLFEDNWHNGLNVGMRPGVPTMNKIIVEGCKFKQKRDSRAITQYRSFSANLLVRDCSIEQTPGIFVEDKTCSPISLKPEYVDDKYCPGEMVFENVTLKGYEGAPLVALIDKSGRSRASTVKGSILANGRKVDLPGYLKEQGLLNDPTPYRPCKVDFAELDFPDIQNAVDAFVPAPYGGGYSILFHRHKDQQIKFSIFSRITFWICEMSHRAVKLRTPDGKVQNVCDLDNATDNTFINYRAPEEGFYEFTSPDWGFYAPFDDKIWKYCYRASTPDGWVDNSYGVFQGVFEVPAGTEEVPLQTFGAEKFRLLNAEGELVASSDRTETLQTHRVKRKGASKAEVWYFTCDRGRFRFFAPMNGIFADCKENLPRQKR